MSSKFLALPTEILITILSHVEPKLLLQSRPVCKTWLVISRDHMLWKMKCEQAGLDLKKKPTGKSWEWFCLAHTIAFKKPPRFAIGKCLLPTGDTFCGDWANGKPDGFGFSCGKKFDYTGEWKDGQVSGRGIKIWKEGDRYEGEFLNGKKTKGMKIYLNGDCYNGEWKDEVRQGRGTYVWVIGDRYEGEWEMGNLHGYGSYHWADSRVYTGEWRRHNQEGRGIFRWPDGAAYDGFWSKGKRHGLGTMTWADGTKWEGDWEADIRKTPLPDRPQLWDNFFNMSFSDQRSFVQDFMNQHNKAAMYVNTLHSRPLTPRTPMIMT
jgi:hypothetical protein